MPNHTAVGLLAKAAGVVKRVQVVIYKSSADAIFTALMGGHVSALATRHVDVPVGIACHHRSDPT